MHAHYCADSNGPFPSVMRRSAPHATNCIGTQSRKWITEVTSNARNERGMNMLPKRRTKTLHESIGILICVVKRHRSNSKRIGFAPIAEYSLSRQFVTQRASTLMDSNRQLCSAPMLFKGSDNGKPLRPLMLQQKLEIGGQRNTFLSQSFDSSLGKNRHRRPQWRHRHDRRIAQLPSFCARHRLEVRSHLKSKSFVVSPPTCEARQTPISRMAFVNEATSNTSRAAIQIFVTAPHCEVGPPLMKTQRNIAGRVRQIKTDDASFSPSSLCDSRHVKDLPSRIVHSTDHDQCARLTFTLDERENIFISYTRLVLTWP